MAISAVWFGDLNRCHVDCNCQLIISCLLKFELTDMPGYQVIM